MLTTIYGPVRLATSIISAIGPATVVTDTQTRPNLHSSWTVDWYYTGTRPAACTFRVEGSTDGVNNWQALTDVIDGTTPGMLHVAYKPVVVKRINILTYNPGDATTYVVVNYTGGS